jgi:hypothetical protein
MKAMQFEVNTRGQRLAYFFEGKEVGCGYLRDVWSCIRCMYDNAWGQAGTNNGVSIGLLAIKS